MIYYKEIPPIVLANTLQPILEITLQPGIYIIYAQTVTIKGEIALRQNGAVVSCGRNYSNENAVVSAMHSCISGSPIKITVLGSSSANYRIDGNGTYHFFRSIRLK